MSAIAQAAERAGQSLLSRYRPVIEVNPALSRAIVSYQSNRNRPYYRWFKYKEGFSAALVEYVLGYLRVSPGALLDPFAGAGAALFAGREQGFAGVGIELLPIGQKAIQARLAADRVDPRQFHEAVKAFSAGGWKRASDPKCGFRHLRITQDAFPQDTELELNQFRAWLNGDSWVPDVRALFELAALNVLEAISYTRKDGQYLRWDARSPRTLRGKPFNKGPIATFDEAMHAQLRFMSEDLGQRDLFPRSSKPSLPAVDARQGSCLHLLPTLAAGQFDVVITSPPYCNRYDYTRTYALELAYLGTDEDTLRSLRQELLSCTVENKPKLDQLRELYRKNSNSPLFSRALEAFEQQTLLRELLGRLDGKGRAGELNNTNVPRMVRNYFLESALVIFELGRVVRPGGYVVMVNDNVQYGGIEIPVDLILCDMASQAGFHTERIWMLGRGKGNSSQQMGAHGRNELRKCAYVWRRD